jgi:DNA-binding NarL/FixJ family response regulator
MNQISVLLVDDHPIVRSGIRNILSVAHDIDIIGEASSGTEALQLIDRLHPDVVLLDMELPDINGNDVASQVQEGGSTSRILALSAHDDEKYIQGLLASGASGYLMKEEVPEVILEAVRGVAKGEQGWLSRRVAAKMSTILREGEHEEKTSLTPREMEALQGVVAGKTNQEIGLDLGISEKTVEKHLDSLFEKLNVKSRVEAAVMAVRKGLV